MRIAVKPLVLISMSVLTLCFVVTAVPKASAQTSGLTVTPATLTLSLASGSTSQTADITVANQYAAPVTLTFSFEHRIGQTSGADPAAWLRISQTSITLGAGEAVHQTIVLSDSTQLSPGSQLADLVITQVATPGANVGILSSIRVPLILIKQAGAVAALKLDTFQTPRTDWSVPNVLGITLRNSGNVIAIPHGFITVTAPNGSVVRKGVLNTASLAVSPGGKLALNTKLDALGGAFWPGIYGVTVSYGLGGGQMATIASKHFFYIAWWHALSLLAIGAAGYYAYKQLKHNTQTKTSPKKYAPKKRILIGRNA